MIDWTQVASQIPVACVIVFLVIKFLWIVKEIVTRFVDHLEKRDVLLVTISDQCHATTDRSSDAVKEFTEAITELRIALNGGRK